MKVKASHWNNKKREYKPTDLGNHIKEENRKKEAFPLKRSQGRIYFGLSEDQMQNSWWVGERRHRHGKSILLRLISIHLFHMLSNICMHSAHIYKSHTFSIAPNSLFHRLSTFEFSLQHTQRVPVLANNEERRSHIFFEALFNKMHKQKVSLRPSLPVSQNWSSHLSSS